MADAPHNASRGMSLCALGASLSYPTRILTVSGQVRLDMSRTQPWTRPGRCGREAPIPLLHTESIGQPMLMSTKSTSCVEREQTGAGRNKGRERDVSDRLRGAF